MAVEIEIIKPGVTLLNGLQNTVTLTTPNSTLNIGTSGQNITLDINLGTANTWTGLQTFNGNANFNGTNLQITSQYVLFNEALGSVNPFTSFGVDGAISGGVLGQSDFDFFVNGGGSGFHWFSVNDTTGVLTSLMQLNVNGALTSYKNTLDDGSGNMTVNGLATLNNGISIPANYGITLNTTASESGQITFATTGAYYTGIEFTNPTDHTYSWLINYNTSPIYAFEVYDFTSNTQLFLVDSSGNATANGYIKTLSNFQVDNATSADGMSMVTNYPLVPTASQNGVEYFAIESAINGTGIFNLYGKYDTNSSAAITDAFFALWGYNLSSDLLHIDFYSGLLSSRHNTLDDGSGNMTVTGKFILNGVYNASDAFEIISTAGAGIVLNEAANNDYELISFTYGGVLTNPAWVIGLNGNFSIFDIGYTSNLNTTNPTNYLTVGSSGALNSYKNTLDDGSGNMKVAGTVTSANKTVYTSGSGTYTVPANCSTIRIALMGGGGGGGVGTTGGVPGAGGGGAGYLIAMLNTSAGATFSYSVGTGGAGGTSGGNGASGGNTTFGIFTANGGGGGTSNTTHGGSGGAVSTEGISVAGQTGLASSTASGGNGGYSAVATGGAGGTSGAGSSGSNGSGGGGGLAGGSVDYDGGNGGNGFIIVEAW